MRLVIADDVALMRDGLASLLSQHGFEIVATVGDAPSLHQSVDRLEPDAAVIDIRMPPTQTNEGLVAAQAIRARHPDVGVLLLSHHLASRYATQLLGEYPERVGYLLKDRVGDVAVLADALKRIGDGECVIDPTIVSRLIRRPREDGPLGGLTDRERDVLGLMAQGRSNAGIADELVLSSKTIETHVHSILLKLDLPESADGNRRVLAVLRYLRET
jgi:DNA-binding NarL/FixJ family response regulator